MISKNECGNDSDGGFGRWSIFPQDGWGGNGNNSGCKLLSWVLRIDGVKHGGDSGIHDNFDPFSFPSQNLLSDR